MKTREEILKELSQRIAGQMQEVWAVGYSEGYNAGQKDEKNMAAYLKDNPNRKLTEE